MAAYTTGIVQLLFLEGDEDPDPYLWWRHGIFPFAGATPIIFSVIVFMSIVSIAGLLLPSCTSLKTNAFLVVLFVMGTAAEVATGRGLADPRYELFVPVPGAPPVAITQHHVLIAVVAWLVEASGMCKKADVTAQGEGERGNREWALGRVRALTGP
mmetsp:Transcript_42943/g.115719  ORF Transcript_42943/g.115719 Transcript_42943/m.115719 type:complete len:156 (-) Transcript_42943:75-542(-)